MACGEAIRNAHLIDAAPNKWRTPSSSAYMLVGLWRLMEAYGGLWDIKSRNHTPSRPEKVVANFAEFRETNLQDQNKSIGLSKIRQSLRPPLMKHTNNSPFFGQMMANDPPWLLPRMFCRAFLYTSPTTKCYAKHKSLKFIGFRGHSVLQNATKGIYKMPPANNTDVSVQHRKSEKKWSGNIKCPDYGQLQTVSF